MPGIETHTAPCRSLRQTPSANPSSTTVPAKYSRDVLNEKEKGERTSLERCDEENTSQRYRPGGGASTDDDHLSFVDWWDGSTGSGSRRRHATSSAARWLRQRFCGADGTGRHCCS